jgi:hypothetical protein
MKAGLDCVHTVCSLSIVVLIFGSNNEFEHYMSPPSGADWKVVVFVTFTSCGDKTHFTSSCCLENRHPRFNTYAYDQEHDVRYVVVCIGTI